MKTQAVVLERPEHLRLSALELTAPGAADLVVDIEFSGISTGTEKLLWNGRMPSFPGMGYPLVPGYEAPINLVYSQRNRSACVRIPITGNNPKAKRLEFRCPDSSGNPYLAFAAMMMAGLDGIKNKIEPHEPVDKDLYELPPEEAKGIPQAPTSLAAVIDKLEEDHEYLTAGGVFTEDLIETWIALKRENEIEPVQIRPHPYEFALYYDC